MNRDCRDAIDRRDRITEESAPRGRNEFTSATASAVAVRRVISL